MSKTITAIARSIHTTISGRTSELPPKADFEVVG
jgi:hypothetical protein